MKRNTLVLTAIITLFSLSISKTQAQIIYDDGGVHELNTVANDDIGVMDSIAGDPTTLNVVTGGRTGYGLGASGNSQINVLGGEVLNGLSLYGNGRAEISGGTLTGDEAPVIISADDYSHVIITGGNLINHGESYGQSFGIVSRGNSLIEIYGTNFFITPDDSGEGEMALMAEPSSAVSVGYGEITVSSGLLTGTLASGEALSVYFQRYDDSASIVLVPEPATLALLGLGAWVLRKRKH